MQTNTGPSYDFEQATLIAHEMIMRYGTCDESTYRWFGKGKKRYTSASRYLRSVNTV